ncbi:ribokinase [Brachybacterium sp. JHP9]|uniref:Ribokinase n=1 Tax=Brachybacterium equifaecis TaxID=2910770 RepID=A0ABT0R3F1_9MICO|nr:ribokinase [Brachybacterium equifaecis]MCL6423993.1 ribokinase [Brachybacterium equifaecis]
MSAETDADVLVIGSLNTDLVIRAPRHPLPGETLHASAVSTLPGGKGANQALAAARAGARTAMIGAVGTDENAQVALSLLRESGVDLRGVDALEGPTGLAVVTVSDDAENSILVVSGANAEVGADRVRAHAEQIAAAPVVVLQGEIPREGIEEAARHCTGRLILNLAPVIAVDPAVILAADPLVVNEHEAALVLEQLTTGQDAPAEEPRRLVQRLRAAGVRSVVLTLGAEGSLLSEGEPGVLVAVPAAPIDAVDTTGAGDAFTGALAAGLAAGQGLREAARRASRFAAFSAQRLGAQSSYSRSGDELPALPGPAEG